MIAYLKDLFLNTLHILLERYATPDFFTWLLLNLGKSGLIFFAAWLVQRIFCGVIGRYFPSRDHAQPEPDGEVGPMIGALLKTLVVYGAYLTAALCALQFFGLNIVAKLNLLAAAGNLLKIVGLIIAARIVVKIGRSATEKLFDHSARTNIFGEEKRLETLKGLSQSIILYGVYFLVFLMILSILGVNTASILASAGILGLAVGFGAQNLVKDVITGFFIIFENYFTIGEYINTAGVGGIVEEMGLRTTKIRDWSGELHVIPNSQISMVTNHCRGKARALVEIVIAYGEDIDRAIQVLQEAADRVAGEYAEVMVDPPVVLGVTDLGPAGVVLRVVASTRAMEQWRVERALRRGLKKALDEAGIEMPYSRALIMQNTQGMKEE